MMDSRADAKNRLQRRNEIGQTHRLVVAEIDRLIRAPLVIHRGANAGNGVVDVRVIAAALTASEEGNTFAARHQLGEFPDGEIRTLTWSIDREEAEREEADPV